MIKRLKWNVLHADDDDDPGGLSSSSDESDQELPSAAALQVLMENDPELNPSGNARELLESKELRAPAQPQSRERKRKRASSRELEQGSSSSDEDNDSALGTQQNDEEQDQTNGLRANEESAQDTGRGFFEWQECLLCPGKKFYRQDTLNDHLRSRKHLKALQKQSALDHQSQTDTGQSMPQAKKSSDQDDEDRIERDKGRSSPKVTSLGLLTPSKIRSMSKKNLDRRETDSQAPPTRQRIDELDDDNIVVEEHTQEAQAEEARRRAKRKKEAAKRKLKSLKKRKWEKLNKDKAITQAETPCE